MRRIHLSLLAVTILVLAGAGTALAWANPSLQSDCAPNENSYAWWVTLPGDEPNYNFDWTFDTGNWASGGTGNAGGTEPFYFTTSRGGSTLHVRWSSDHNAKASATANAELCENKETPTPTPDEGTPTPTPDEGTPTPTPDEGTPTPTPEGTAAGGTGTPAGGSIPDTALSLQNQSGSMATIAFGLILVAALGALAFANVRSSRR